MKNGHSVQCGYVKWLCLERSAQIFGAKVWISVLVTMLLQPFVPADNKTCNSVRLSEETSQIHQNGLMLYLSSWIPTECKTFNDITPSKQARMCGDVPLRDAYFIMGVKRCRLGTGFFPSMLWLSLILLLNWEGGASRLMLGRVPL